MPVARREPRSQKHERRDVANKKPGRAEQEPGPAS